MTTPEIVPEPAQEASQSPVKETAVSSETASSQSSQINPTPGPFNDQKSQMSDTASAQPQATNVHTVTITIPATKDQLDDWAKGPADVSLTWDALYWLRMIKKAILYGWNVTVGVQT